MWIKLMMTSLKLQVGVCVGVNIKWAERGGGQDELCICLFVIQKVGIISLYEGFFPACMNAVMRPITCRFSEAIPYWKPPA